MEEEKSLLNELKENSINSQTTFEEVKPQFEEVQRKEEKNLIQMIHILMANYLN